MKLAAISAIMACSVTALGDKCHKIPIGGPRRYTQPRTIQNGNNQPEGINFMIENRGKLLNVFKAGQRTSADLETTIFEEIGTLSLFAHTSEDAYLGQIYRTARQDFNELVSDGEAWAKTQDEEYAHIFRDNTQRLGKLLRDITFNPEWMAKLKNNLDLTVELKAMVENSPEEVYKYFIQVHIEEFIPWVKMQVEDMNKIRQVVVKQVAKILQDEKIKGKYRQMVNELPLVYQFFNDNIDFIQMNNMDKDLDSAIATDIMLVLAQEQGDSQVEGMINRHLKFIKKMMTQQATHQQKEKAVSKVMEKNKQLREAAFNEEEFNRLRKEAVEDGKTVTKEMEKEIWAKVKADTKSEQKAEKANQMEVHSNKKKRAPLGRYEHLAGIVSLMPDELLDTIAAMVKESCPELDLIRIGTPAMKEIMEAQPVNFIDQLLGELHDVCDMFGLVDASKVITTNINGVEVQMYAADWLEGGKTVDW